MNLQAPHQTPFNHPLPHGQQSATQFDDGYGEPVIAGDRSKVEEGARQSSGAKKKVQFKDKDIWVGGQSVVGRKGKDGEWTEVRCGVM